MRNFWQLWRRNNDQLFGMRGKIARHEVFECVVLGQSRGMVNLSGIIVRVSVKNVL